jgi:uncharacterized protein (DUF1015 family)
MNVIGKQKILLPHNVDLQKWAVIACDQFTSEPSYWKKLESFVGDSPSTLKLIFPEVYLNDNVVERIENINITMTNYLKKGILKEIDGFVLVEREVEFGHKRIGLILSVDLEKYDWNRVRCMIRATEDTLVERLPPRVRIRRNADIELSHILVLIDDSKKEIIEPVYKNKAQLKKLYDFELNMGGGHICGYEVDNTHEIVTKLEKLLDPKVQREKYGWDAGLLFAVGDGNHSLASAKKWWDELKINLSEEERENHPARYALLEVVNIYDDALNFEPIHRVMNNCDVSFVDKLKSAIHGEGSLKLFTKDKEFIIPAPSKSSELIKQVQNFIEEYNKQNHSKVDYIHGEDHLREVVHNTDNSIGIVMPYFAKNELFNYVLNVGNLPKKAFSIGNPEFKRYYLECKRIRY